jgi:hypothetical protein
VTANLCVRCGRPAPDGYACRECGQELADALLGAAGHAEDAEAVIARQARYGTGARGGSGDGLTYDPKRSETFTAVTLAICGWARIVVEETGRQPHWRPLSGPLCPPTGIRCDHDSCEGIRRRLPPSDIARDAAWLARQSGWLRKHPAAAEAFAELHAACDQLARLVDRPADKELVGMCDCGRVLYAPHGKTMVTCPVLTCQLRWNVEQSRDILRRALDDKLVTAADAARLAQYLDSDRTQDQIRKLINKWAERVLIEAHGEIGGEPTYRFSDIANRLARTPRRAVRQAA